MVAAPVERKAMPDDRTPKAAAVAVLEDASRTPSMIFIERRGPTEKVTIGARNRRLLQREYS